MRNSVRSPEPYPPVTVADTLNGEQRGNLMTASSTPTVFVVDDDASVRKATSRLLGAAGFNAVAFASAEEFLAQYDPEVPGCLVLDLAMPKLDGLQVQDLLAKSGSFLPIIFLTGHGDISKSVQAMKRGDSDFLTKPVNDDDLVAAVYVAIQKDRVRRQEQAELSEIRARFETLTPRERDVLEHVIAGKVKTASVGEHGAAESTEKIHWAQVMQKMKARSVAELVRLTEAAESAGSKDGSASG